MIDIALCGIPASVPVFQSVLKTYSSQGSLIYQLIVFEDLEQLLLSELPIKVFILNKDERENTEEKIKDYINNNSRRNTIKKNHHFIIYVDNPITPEDCRTVLDSLKQHFEYELRNPAIDFLTDKGLKRIPIDMICYFEYVGRKIKIVTNHETYYTNDTLKNVMALLQKYPFAVPHKSFLVNLQHISNIKNYEITMNDGSIIPLSQKRSRQFRDQYKLFVQQRLSKMAENLLANV